MTDLSSFGPLIACVLLGLVVFYFIWTRLLTRGKHSIVLICGPSGCGKTKIYTEIAFGKQLPTVTSQLPNATSCDLAKACSKSDSTSSYVVKLVDIPGSRQLIARFIPEYVGATSAVVFMLKTFTPSSQALLATTADCLLQLIEANLLGPKRKNSSIELLFLIQPDEVEKSSFSTVTQAVKSKLQNEIDRLTCTGNSGAVPLGGVNNSSPNNLSVPLDKLARRVDWIVSRAENEEDMVNARDVADWLLNIK